MVFGRAQHEYDIGGLSFVAVGLPFDPHRKVRDEEHYGGQPCHHRVPDGSFHLCTFIVIATAKWETIAGAANPTLKDFRRTIVRQPDAAGMVRGGELRSDCGICRA